MKNYFMPLLLCCIVLGFSSCYTTKYVSVPLEGKMNEIFVGKNTNEIYQQLGVPDKTADDGNGGKILIYEEKTTHVSGSSSTATTVYPILDQATTRGSSNATLTENKKYINLFMSADDKCYLVRTNYCDTKTEEVYSKKLTGTLIGSIVAGIVGFIVGISPIFFM